MHPSQFGIMIISECSVRLLDRQIRQLLYITWLYHNNGDEREFVINMNEATGEISKPHIQVTIILRTDYIKS